MVGWKSENMKREYRSVSQIHTTIARNDNPFSFFNSGVSITIIEMKILLLPYRKLFSFNATPL